VSLIVRQVASQDMQACKFIVALALAAGVASAAGGNAEIPPALKDKAERVFAEGKPYFVWSTNAEPVIGWEAAPGIGSMVSINVQMIARSPTNTPDFRFKSELEFIDRRGPEKITTSIGTFPGGEGPSFTFRPKGRTAGGHPVSSELMYAGARDVALKGSGTIRIQVFKADDQKMNTNAISNTLEMKVKFSDSK
jgi:hypothetical protein